MLAYIGTFWKLSISKAGFGNNMLHVGSTTCSGIKQLSGAFQPQLMWRIRGLCRKNGPPPARPGHMLQPPPAVGVLLGLIQGGPPRFVVEQKAIVQANFWP